MHFVGQSLGAVNLFLSAFKIAARVPIPVKRLDEMLSDRPIQLN